jgi:hypothetical protein
MIGTCAIGVTDTWAWQISGIVGVAVMVGVGVSDGVCVIVGVSVGTGVGVGTQPVAVQASQQLVKPVVQLWPPLGARHFAGLDFTLHLVFPRAVVRQQVTQPAGRPQVDLVAHFFTAEAQCLGSVPSVTAWSTTPFAQRM